MFSLAPVLLIAVGAASFFLTRQTAVDQPRGRNPAHGRRRGSRGQSAVCSRPRAASGKNFWAIGTGVITFLLGASVVFAEIAVGPEHHLGCGCRSELGAVVILKYLFDRLLGPSRSQLGVGFLLWVSLVISAAITALQGYSECAKCRACRWFGRPMNIATSFVARRAPVRDDLQISPRMQRSAWTDVWIGAAVTSAALHRRQIRDQSLPWADRNRARLGRLDRSPSCSSGFITRR